MNRQTSVIVIHYVKQQI